LKYCIIKTIMHMVISEFIKRYWQWLLVVLSMVAGQFALLTMRPSATFFMMYKRHRSLLYYQISGPMEYENDDPAHGVPLRWTANAGELRLLGGVTQSDVLMSLLVHTGRAPGSVTTLKIQDQTNKTLLQSHLPTGWRRIWLLVPAPPWSDGYQSVHYQVDGDQLADRRMLGVAVQHIARHAITLAPNYAHFVAAWVYAVLFVCGLVLVVYRQGWHWGLVGAGVVLIWGVQVVLASCVVTADADHLVGVGLGDGVVRDVVAAPYRQAYLPFWVSVLGGLGAVWLLRMGYMGAGVLLLGGVWFAMPNLATVPGSTWVPRWWRWLLLGAVVAGAILRIGWLDGLPQGMFRDEARHGGLAQQVLSGDWLIYSPFANLPAGYFYLSALPIGVFGPSAFAIRIVAAVVGSATIVVAYWALYPWWGQSFALLTSIVLTPFLWHMGLSRIGFPATIWTVFNITVYRHGMAWIDSVRHLADGDLGIGGGDCDWCNDAGVSFGAAYADRRRLDDYCALV
jgi:hypothetical protein